MWHCALSVFVDIPDNSRGSFYHGDVHITLKDKIFQPSTPFRHAAETVKIVRSYFSEYDVNANKPIIVRYTDGGPQTNICISPVGINIGIYSTRP